MPRKYAFCYAVGDGRHPGEVKIGNTSAETFESAVAKVTSRYRVTYGRCLIVYKVIPVALPKKDAEDIIKDMLSRHHACGELYDLPTEDVEDTQRFLDLVYADLDVPFAEAHHVDKPSPLDRKAELVRQREELVAREEDRVEHKRARLEMQKEEDERLLLDREEQRLARRLEEELEEDAKREKKAAKMDEGVDLAQWVVEHVHSEEGKWFLLQDAHAEYRALGGKLGRNKFRERLESALPRGCYYERKTINAVDRRSVFWAHTLTAVM